MLRGAKAQRKMGTGPQQAWSEEGLGVLALKLFSAASPKLFSTVSCKHLLPFTRSPFQLLRVVPEYRPQTKLSKGSHWDCWSGMRKMAGKIGLHRKPSP